MGVSTYHPPAMSNDIFAELLRGSEPAAGTSSNANNLSLNQRMMTSSMNTSSASGKANGGLDLDFLDTYVSKPSSSATSVNTPAKTNQSAAASDIDDLLFSIPTPKQNAHQQSTPQTTHNNDGNLLDDFFDQPIPKKTTPSVQKQMPTPAPSPKPAEAQASPPESRQNRVDSALAELMDMGFPLEKASIALEATSNGYDINEAISYLMEQAHSSTRRTAPQRYQPPQQQSQDDIGKFVNDISTDLMSTASFLFNSGKKKIQQGVDMYRQQKFENNDGQPIWMKNQMKYKANSMKLPNYDDEEDEMDPETMKNLIHQQRLREQRLKQEKKQDLLSDDTTPASPSSGGPSRVPSVDRRQEKYRPQPQVQAQPQRTYATPSPQQQPKSNAPSPSSDIYVSASRHRRKPASQPVEIPSLIETSSTPAPRAKQSNNTLTIPLLDSAQKMSFTSSREIAQEKFKKGDYPSALENYLSASKVISADHPYQIILDSNLALVYSKLGNPKDQLVVSTRGLDLISILTNQAPISQLSTVMVEDNKNIKSFWVKLMTKRAESLEFTEKWTDAKESYEKLVSEGESTKAIMDGKNRCLKALNPKPVSKPAPPKSVQSRPRTTTAPSFSQNLKNVQESNKKKEKEDEEKFNLHDQVEAKLDRWRMGNKDNIRALICSLDNILWPGLNWKPVKLTDLVLDNKVKINYMKAVAKTHPDKISSNESTENKMIANGVFITLNEAWETFKQSKGM